MSRLVVRVYRDYAYDWRWSVQDFGNRKIIGASSEGYVRRSACLANLKRIVDLSPPVWQGHGQARWVALG